MLIVCPGSENSKLLRQTPDKTFSSSSLLASTTNSTKSLNFFSMRKRNKTVIFGALQAKFYIKVNGWSGNRSCLMKLEIGAIYPRAIYNWEFSPVS